jgi:uncharacterized protein with GYD domain
MVCARRSPETLKEDVVATYVILASLTDQGARTMDDLRRRLENARTTFSSLGAELKQLYFSMGTYDYVVIGEAPDDATMTRVALAVSGQGNVRTNTFRVFTEEEALQLVEGGP